MMTADVEEALRGFDVARARPPRLDGDVVYVVEDFAVGRLLLAARGDGVLLASRYVADAAAEDAVLDRLARAASPRVIRSPGALDEPRRELEEYLAGRRRRFGLSVEPMLATGFQKVVLAALADVRYGRTTSYGALAAAIGRPSAARAVGAALGANPLCVVLPCHRVVASGGALTGYAGGLTAKRYLLALEAGGHPQ